MASVEPPGAPTPAELRAGIEAALPGALAPAGKAAEPDAPSRHAGPRVVLQSDHAVVLPERLVEVATYLRDTLGYVYLSNLTVVDYLAEGLFELVYHFYRLEGGPPVVLRVRVPRANPVVPSLSPEWPGANLQEREGYDLYGVVFDGHPDLRRLYLWDEFEGHPMRRDYPKQGDKYIGEEEE